jgi:hypothetical protein
MVLTHCIIPNTEKTMDNKDLILNATPQNNAIKEEMGRSTKGTYELWKLAFIKKNCPCDIPSL